MAAPLSRSVVVVGLRSGILRPPFVIRRIVSGLAIGVSEPPNAWVKSVLGFRQFSMRGLAKAQAEWKLVCTALNLRRMAKMMYA